MVASADVRTADDREAVRLGAADVQDMLELVRATDPGPFGTETYRMGTYLGIRCDGALVAMAGERLNPRGWTEIGAVCTDPAFRAIALYERLGFVVRKPLHFEVVRPPGQT